MSAFVVSNDRSDGTPNVPNANVTGKWRSILWRRNREAGQGTSTSIYLWDEAVVTEDPVYLKWVPIGNFIATTDLLSLQAGSSKLSITSSAGNVYFDAVESAFTIANISGDLPLSKLPATVPLIDAANTFSLHNTFSAGLTGDLTGNATSADKIYVPRSIYLTGDATGSVSSVDWSQDVTINTTVTPLAVESNLPHWNASRIMSRIIGNQTPTDGDVYAWDQGNQEWVVTPTHPTALPNLLDVTISSLTDGQFIKYVSASSDWENFSPTTDNITEGTNLYYTDERVDDRLSTLIQEGTGINHVYDDAANTYTLSVDFGDFTTSNLAEGTNLYYTDSRVRLAVSASSPITYNNSTGSIGWNGTTTDVSEGTNLYYTDARWDTRLGTKDTDDLTEGSSSLYFTNARARGALSVTGDITYSSTTGIFSHTDAIQSVNAATGTVVLGTDDVAEGSTNLYYTEARVAANTDVTANTAKVTNVSTDLSVSRDGTKIDVVSSDGTNAVLPLADTNNWGVMSDEMFDKLDAIAGSNSGDEVAATETVAGIVELATTLEATTGTDTVRAVTPAGVQAAVDEILDGAPAALDTLNELAAAIDDDASYASTITTALGLKAPIASPTFTGTVAIPNIANLETAVAANTLKVSDINHNVTTNLSVSRDGTKLDVVSSDGTNAVLPLADTNNWGVMSDEMFDEHEANNAKVTDANHNVTTDLSVSRDGTKLDVVSSDGTNAVLPLADTNNWGVMSDEMFDEHEANNAKVTDANHNVTTDLSVSRDGTKLDVVSSDGTNAVLPLADTTNWGVMSDEMFDKLDGIEAGATAEAAATTTTAGIVELATNAETTTGTDTTRAVTPAGVQAAVDSILDGAPAALDTLNELAAAIDDDASYAASVTTALGNRATTAGTPSDNQVAVWTSSSGIEGTSSLVFDGTGLGIGTSAPDYELDVAGDIGIDRYIYHNGDADTYLSFTNNNVALYAGGAGLFIDSGLCGIGTTAPSDKLSVVGTGQSRSYTSVAGTLLTVEDTNPNITILGSATSESSRLLFAAPANQNEGTIGYSNNSDYMWFETNDEERLRITSGGDCQWYNTSAAVKMTWDASESRLGIRVEVPTKTLDVGGDVRVKKTASVAAHAITFYPLSLEVADSAGDFYNSQGCGIKFLNTATSGTFTSAEIVGETSSLSGDGTKGELVFKTSTSSTPTERMRIDGAGNITVTGTVDGRDVATDGTKLDGVETGATKEVAATTTVAGIVELATNAETTTGTDTTRAVTPAGVQAAVDEILDGAPAALDTLNELADAINDDASYASTITTALGLKAPKADPTFTGTVAIPNIADLETAVAANTAKVSDINHNATHTGDVTGATSLTIEDNAVTIAKMAGLTRGSVIIGNSSGDPAALAISASSGYVLTSDGTDIAWAAGGGGGGSGHAIKDEGGTALSTRNNLDFVGELVAATDNSGDDSTDITIDAKTAWLYG